MAYFGNDAHDGFHAQSYQYKPGWERLVDYNPDHRPAEEAPVTDVVGGITRTLLSVQGVGTLILSMETKTERFLGVTIRTLGERC